MDADGEIVRRLTRHPAEDASPVWGPNGHWIVFISGWVENYDIYRIDVDGTNRRRLTHHLAWDIEPTWVPAVFFPVSPTINTQATLWGRLKQSVGD